MSERKEKGARVPFKDKFSRAARQLRSPFAIIMCLVIGLVCATFVYALVWGLLTSLKSNNNFSGDMFGLPVRLYFKNYATVMKNLYVTVGMKAGGNRRATFFELTYNSLLYSVTHAGVGIFSHAAVAYAVCKYRFKFNKVMHFIVVFTIVVPIVGSLGAGLNYIRALGVYDNFWAHVYTCINFADAGFLIWYGIFKGISSEYMDAAKVDGAGHWRIMLTIMFPMARVPFMVFFVLNFISLWNSFQTQITTLPGMPNLARALWEFNSSNNNAITEIPVQIAAAMIVTFPCLVLFLIFNRWLVGNVTMGGLKA
jgi:multiple sugar transport system permease protein